MRTSYVCAPYYHAVSRRRRLRRRGGGASPLQVLALLAGVVCICTVKRKLSSRALFRGGLFYWYPVAMKFDSVLLELQNFNLKKCYEKVTVLRAFTIPLHTLPAFYTPSRSDCQLARYG